MDGDFWGLITWGPPGSGKSRKEIKDLAQAYGEWDKVRDPETGAYVSYVPLDGMNWDAWKEWMKHDLGDFLSMIQRVQDKGRQVVMGVLDDAGRVASNQKWQSEFGKAINDYANVQRRDFASLHFTTPNPQWILGHIRGMPGGHTARVVKLSGNKYQRHMRCAKVYEGWMSPDFRKSGVSLLWEDYFDVWLPPRVEKEWEEVNRTYSKLALEEAKKVYAAMREKGQDKKAEQFKAEQEAAMGMKIDPDDYAPTPDTSL